MIRKTIKSLPIVLVMSLVGLVSFSAVAFAAGEAIPADGSALDLLTPVYEAFTHGNYILAGCLVVVAGVALAKRYGIVKSEKGMIGLAFAGAFAATLSTSAAAGTLAWSSVWLAFKIGAGAAGGYAALKVLLVEPYLKPLQAKLPSWAQLPLSLVLWIFSKKASTPTDGEKQVAKAEAAGQAAVEAKPAPGAASVIGAPTEIN